MHAELLHALALLSPVVRELRRLVLELRRAHGQIDHRRERMAFLVDQLMCQRARWSGPDAPPHDHSLVAGENAAADFC